MALLGRAGRAGRPRDGPCDLLLLIQIPLRVHMAHSSPFEKSRTPPATLQIATQCRDHPLSCTSTPQPSLGRVHTFSPTCVLRQASGCALFQPQRARQRRADSDAAAQPVGDDAGRPGPQGSPAGGEACRVHQGLRADLGGAAPAARRCDRPLLAAPRSRMRAHAACCLQHLLSYPPQMAPQP